MSFTLMMTRWLSVSRRGKQSFSACQELWELLQTNIDNLNIIKILFLSMTFFSLIDYHNVDSRFENSILCGIFVFPSLESIHPLLELHSNKSLQHFTCLNLKGKCPLIANIFSLIQAISF